MFVDGPEPRYLQPHFHAQLVRLRRGCCLLYYYTAKLHPLSYLELPTLWYLCIDLDVGEISCEIWRRHALRRPSELLWFYGDLSFDSSSRLPSLWLCIFLTSTSPLLPFSCSPSEYSQAGNMHKLMSAIRWSVYHKKGIQGFRPR
jgi:hypothetical protein